MVCTWPFERPRRGLNDVSQSKVGRASSSETASSPDSGWMRALAKLDVTMEVSPQKKRKVQRKVLAAINNNWECYVQILGDLEGKHSHTFTPS